MRWATALVTTITVALLACNVIHAIDDEGFDTLFNGKDLDGWKAPAELDGKAPWMVIDGVIDCDVRRQSKGEQELWTQKTYKDFVLKVEWRIKETPFTNTVPEILPDGTHKKDEDGKEIRHTIQDCDSGIYLRGSSKSQVNIWCWPVGSGEVYGYRTDGKMPPEVRAGVTPKKKADKPIGEWNAFEITLKGDRLWVKLNGEEVITNAELPGIPPEGPIALQFHGGFDAKSGKFTGSPSQVQFRNVMIKELK